MTSVERFATGRLAQSGWVKSAWLGRDSTMGQVARFIPGVGAIGTGADAIQDFSQGKIWSGLGNTAMTALNLTGGGALAKGLFKGVGMLGKIPGIARAGGALARSTPTIGKYIANPAMSAVRGVGNTMSSMGSSVGKAVSGFKPVQALANTRPGQAVSSVGRWAGQNPGKTNLIGGAGVAGADHMQGISDMAHQGQEQAEGQMKDMMSNIHRSPVFQNPMTAGFGSNANYADTWG